MPNPIAINMVSGEPLFDESVSEISLAFKECRVTFFAGAGISQPSGLPTSPVLVEKLVEAMVESLAATGIGRTDERDAVRNVIKKYPLERLLDALVDIHGDQAALTYLSVLQGATENYNHQAIAELAARGMIDNIVTLNFDVLFEQALMNRSVSFAWNLPLASEVRIPESDARVTVIKPHGTLPLSGFPYARHYLAATLRYAGDSPQKETAQLFSRIATKKPVLVVAGYSDKDWDISPLLTVAPWSHVYWCEHVDPSKLSTLPPKQPCERVLKWLESRPESSAFLLRGDIRTLLSNVLRDGNAAHIWREEPRRTPDASIFLRFPARTTLATVRLLDGTSNAIYRSLLPQFGTILSLIGDDLLRRHWERTVSWFHHAHRRDIRKAITVHQRLLKGPRPPSLEGDLQYLRDIKTLYYEYVSAAKRPYLNPRWPVDLFRAARIRKLLRRLILTVKSSAEATPWSVKEAERQEAYTAYYQIDLLHNWGYHLLPFKNRLVRRLIRKAFRSIAERYRQTLKRYPVLDWEYHYVRGVEAALIADDGFDQSTVKNKLREIADMFERTGSYGHFSYVKAIAAIIAKSEVDFATAEAIFFQENSGTTPSGKLRMRLIRRYFWPHTISGYAVLRDIIKYSAVQKQ